MTRYSIDQARLMPHLRTRRPDNDPEPFTDRGRRNDPDRLRNTGIVGSKHRLIRATAGAHFDLIRQRDRRRKLQASEEAILLHLRDDSRCYLCNARLDQDNATVDHIIPLSRGGDHTTANVELACRSCNSRKNNRYVAFMVNSRKPTYLPR